MPARITLTRLFGAAKHWTGAALLTALLLGALAAPAAAQIVDADNDGLFDADEALYGADPQKADTDGDILTDGFEVYEFGSSPALADTDGDRLTDYREWVYGTAPRNPDTDGDRIGDKDEIDAYFTDPLVNNYPVPATDPGPDADAGDDSAGRPDGDGDGLFDDDETDVYGTKPDVFDTDNDGVGDGEEIWNRDQSLPGPKDPLVNTNAAP